MDALNQARLRSRLVRQFYDEAKFIGATIGPGGIWGHITNISKYKNIPQIYLTMYKLIVQDIIQRNKLT